MEYNYIDIQAHIRQANQMRSDAMGEIIAMGWNHLKQVLSRASRKSMPALPTISS